jgi:hypothetical protein
MEESESEHKRLLNMLNSPDTENAVVALQCLENMNFDDKIVTIMCLFKTSKCQSSVWIEHANKTYNKIQHYAISTNAQIITYRDILNALKGKTITQEQIDVFLESVDDSLRSTFAQYQINIIPNE